MRKLKITGGEWKTSYTTDGKVIVVSPWNNTTVKVEDTPTFGDYRGAHICSAEYNSGVPTKEQAISNLSFVAEAGTVANETGLMPREMKEQRDRLLERLKITDRALKAAIEEYRFPLDSGLRIALEALIKYNEQVIAAAEGRGIE